MTEPVRVVVVGCGSIANAWMKAMSGEDSVRVVGLMDVRPEAMQQFAGKHGLEDVATGTALAELLQQVRPDAVFNCATPEAHLPVTLAALEAGCHVLGEKPLADSMENARTMVAAADAAGRIFAVIQNRRYQAAIRSLRAFLDSGRIGSVTTINADFYLGAHFGGFRDHMRHVLLLDMAIHSFDQARLISAADPVAVYCHEWNPKGSWYDVDASAQCIFEMTNGIVFNYRGSWCAEGINTSWECDWRIVGERGSVRWDGGEGFAAEVVVAQEGFMSEMETVEIPVTMPAGMYPGHKGCIMEFLQCIRHGGVPETVAADNIRSLAMVFGAIASADSGQRVPVHL